MEPHRFPYIARRVPVPDPRYCIGIGYLYDDIIMRAGAGYVRLGVNTVRSAFADPEVPAHVTVKPRGIVLRAYRGGGTWRLSTPADLYRDHRVWGVMNVIERMPATEPIYLALGNEPNGQPDPYLWNEYVPPDLYAAWVHTMTEFLAPRCPNCIFSLGGLAVEQGDRDIIPYLDAFWSSYQAQFGTVPPIDILDVHVYDWAGHDPEGVISSVRSWMECNDQLDLPLWVTEFGVLDRRASPDFVINWMEKAIDVFSAPPGEPGSSYPERVQMWCWFTSFVGIRDSWGNWFWGQTHAFDQFGQLTQVGDAYRLLALR